MREQSKLPKALLEHLPWQTQTNPIWLTTSFLLHRNLSRHHFPGKLTESQSKQVLEKIKGSLLKSQDLNTPTFLGAQELSPLDREYLFEHFLCLDSFQNVLDGQGFIVDQTACFLGMLNIEDHLRMLLIDNSGNWEGSWNKLSQIEMVINEQLEFAFSSRFGYLTASPLVCGTGLLVSTHLHVPALIHTGQLEETLLKQLPEDVVASGVEGRLESLTGDLLVLRNHYTLGLSEENILHSLHETTMRLMALEKMIRAHLKQEGNAELKDHVSRAYGLLLHSYQLQAKEALDALSLLKLGLDLGWVAGTSEPALSELFFLSRRAHLLYNRPGGAEVSHVELPHLRAEFLHQKIKEIKLLT